MFFHLFLQKFGAKLAVCDPPVLRVRSMDRNLHINTTKPISLSLLKLTGIFQKQRRKKSWMNICRAYNRWTLAKVV
jgi:hypothetical protein